MDRVTADLSRYEAEQERLENIEKWHLANDLDSQTVPYWQYQNDIMLEYENMD